MKDVRLCIQNVYSNVDVEGNLRFNSDVRPPHYLSMLLLPPTLFIRCDTAQQSSSTSEPMALFPLIGHRQVFSFPFIGLNRASNRRMGACLMRENLLIDLPSVEVGSAL